MVVLVRLSTVSVIPERFRPTAVVLMAIDVEVMACVGLGMLVSVDTIMSVVVSTSAVVCVTAAGADTTVPDDTVAIFVNPVVDETAVLDGAVIGSTETTADAVKVL